MDAYIQKFDLSDLIIWIKDKDAILQDHNKNTNERKPVTGIRELAKNDIEFAYKFFKEKIYKEYSEYHVSSFEVVMVSKLSNEVKKYLEKAKRPLAD